MAPSVLKVRMSHIEREGLRMLSERQEVSEEHVLRRLLRAALVETGEYQRKPAPRGIWDEVKEYAIGRVESYGYVTTSDLRRDIGMSPTTAGRYIDLLITRLGWTSEPVQQPVGRGRPAKSAGPKDTSLQQLQVLPD